MRDECHHPDPDGALAENKVVDLSSGRDAQDQNTRVICSANVEMLLDELKKPVEEAC